MVTCAGARGCRPLQVAAARGSGEGGGGGGGEGSPAAALGPPPAALPPTASGPVRAQVDEDGGWGLTGKGRKDPISP
jgi:hypothetical protein